MVVKLPLPEICSMDLLEAVLKERSRGANAQFFAGISAEWRKRVKDYLKEGGSPEHVERWAAIAAKKESFINLYAAAAVKSSQRKMLESLRAHGLSLCPACGEPGRPNTLDHYLPKNGYPHFAVTPANLFPMCDACQTEKGEKTGGGGDPRYFVHPYFDEFSHHQVMVLTIETPFDAPSFTLDPNPALDADERRLIGAHLRELGVHERYRAYFVGEHRRLLRLVEEMRKSEQDIAATLATFKRRAELVSPNSWDHVFYDCVVGNADLMTYLASETLPPFL